MRLSIFASGLVALALACNASSDVSREVGARCQAHDECDDLCLQGAFWPDGFCTLHCSEHRECPDDSRCVDQEQGVCLFTCVESADCAFLGPGWYCTDLIARPDGAPISACTGPEDAGLP